MSLTLLFYRCFRFRLAANQKHYLSTVMQIRDPRHKRRLVIKATDVVLFGPPQRS